MKCKDTEVEFKSIPPVYWLEKDGSKNHTERLISKKEAEWLNKNKVKTIYISQVEYPALHFTREVTNIFKEGEILGHYLYSFTWKHEGDLKK